MFLSISATSALELGLETEAAVPVKQEPETFTIRHF